MKYTICTFFGIRTDEIEHVNDICQNVLKNAGFNLDEIDDIYGRIKNDVQGLETFYDMDITDSIIYCMFDNVMYELRNKFDKLDIDYNVNGGDSYMTINRKNAEEFDFDKLI